MDNQTTEAWHPMTAEYDRTRSAWLVLFARYSEAGWQFSERVVDADTDAAQRARRDSMTRERHRDGHD